MKREIIQTEDGSTTIHLTDLNESYHSKHGAIQEAYHVFIKNGLSLFEGKSVSILEIGFGTGLNTFITYLEGLKSYKEINYTGIEAYPISASEVAQMNYVQELEAQESSNIFDLIHNCPWEVPFSITPHFSLIKRQQLFQDISEVNSYDLIYFDAFGFRVQPELWSEEIFQLMYNSLKNEGVLVTYACRSSIKKAMLAVGFEVEKLPGAPGKREMLRAFKR
ncbi:tRNA (5-methylaminomethyl-2-thiouridine)(34)-methyltransferase MnmD [Flavobacterium sp. SUN046]|uniref:tRNA (5-methylaminomethyl-2-thiouridine)(34)-methyltransferase MnmD n=1 Tax=Flavobacterium sp. SUN046 TaxID=3002440 RepID=UPI002DB64C17|nr:tRNA (5-methylaminomethyl-2-thiouridine)(34)-methyltransferase MnmD [Flavobacterium sp. SUN046]MEC4048638.1 tRNA (5-methylaminomethyl-2-thiouridine)(34)-methyltransferase MnmD [Flavobacterium sp. SUN046]